MLLQVFAIGLKRRTGGADGIVARSLKKTEEKPLNSSVYCHLLIFPMSLRNPLRFFGHPYNAPLWQQLATVDNGLSEVATRRAISHNPILGNLRVAGHTPRTAFFTSQKWFQLAHRGCCMAIYFRLCGQAADLSFWSSSQLSVRKHEFRNKRT